MLERVRGLPWEPVPGRGSLHIPVKVANPDSEGDV